MSASNKISTGDGMGCAVRPEASFVGVLFSGNGAQEFWQIKCPCGVVATYAVNKLPEVDTPHPCGNPNHWTVRYAYRKLAGE